MAAIPNRREEVKAIAARYPQSFGEETPEKAATIDARRRLLMPIIVRELNKIDGPEAWKLMNRLDRNDEDPKPGRLTSDVIVHAATKIHVDVLSSNGAMWKELGPVTDKDWKLESWTLWPSWDTLAPEPKPDPKPNPDAPPSAKNQIIQILAQQTDKVIAVMNETRDRLEGVDL